MYIASSFSNLQKTRRKPCMRRNSLSISLRRLYSAVSCSQGSQRLDFGGTTGENPRLHATRRVRSSSYALSMTKGVAPSSGPTVSIRSLPCGASWHCPPLRMSSAAVRASKAIMWILQVRPPLERPIACPPFFLKPRRRRDAQAPTWSPAA